MKQNIPLDRIQKKRLKLHRKALLGLLNKNKSEKLKKKKVIQSGEFLSIVLVSK